MEQEHPIPQQISSYQFRLVGDMTLKQFAEVAGGAIVALIIYSSGLPSYVRWPLIIVSFLFGVAMAFFPLEDRPLETWILAFIKTIYSPTLYVWKKLSQKPSFFQPEPATQLGATPQPSADTATVVNLQEPPPFHSLEKGEEEFLSRVTEHFSTPLPTHVPVSTAKITPTTPFIPRVIQPPRKKGVEVQRVTPIKVEHKMATPKVLPQKPKPSTSEGYLSPSIGQKTTGALAAKFSPEAAPPVPPTKPNIIVGQVVNPDGKIVEGAILEIKDEDGRSVRALKSNKLGHFMIVTPLSNGKYQIITEGAGLEFSPIELKVKGEIVPPIAIWAKKTI